MHLHKLPGLSKLHIGIEHNAGVFTGDDENDFYYAMTRMPLQHQAKPDGTKWRREPVLQTRGSKFIKFQEARLQVCVLRVCAWDVSADRVSSTS